jgi:hypothetical protein
MRELASTCVVLSFFLSTCALAEEHFLTGKEHANAAVIHGIKGHTRILMEHAKAALEHTLEASLTAKGIRKSHLEAAVKELQECLDLAGNGHIGAATMHAEAAEKHIKASEK